MPSKQKFKVGDIVRFQNGSVDWTVTKVTPQYLGGLQRVEIKSGQMGGVRATSSARLVLSPNQPEAVEFAAAEEVIFKGQLIGYVLEVERDPASCAPARVRVRFNHDIVEWVSADDLSPLRSNHSIDR